jgi:hypothetical protein
MGTISVESIVLELIIPGTSTSRRRSVGIAVVDEERIPTPVISLGPVINEMSEETWHIAGVGGIIAGKAKVADMIPDKETTVKASLFVL